MDEQFIIDELNRLAQLQSHRDALNVDVADRCNHIAQAYEEKIRALLTPEQLRQIDSLNSEKTASLSALEYETTEQLMGVARNIAECETGIRNLILAAGKSVKGAYLHAIFVKGRVAWDTKRIDGYAAAHPEILQFRSEGEPSVSIRAVK